MARINLTGFTGAHVKGSNQKNVISFSNLLKELLNDQGYEADYGLKDPDLNIVCVLDLSSINSSNAVNCLELLRKENCIIAFDDWNIAGFYHTLDKILETKSFSKTHHTVDYKGVLEHLDVIEMLTKGEFKSIFPAYTTGDHDLLGIRGEKYCIDPSIYIEKQWPLLTWSDEKIIPVHASLAPKWSYLSKKKYSFINLKGEKEDTVFEYYCRHRIVMSPEHYFSYKAGWFRNRYALANLAKAIVIEENNSCFGETYAVERKSITSKNVDSIFEKQDAAYKETIMSKDEIKDVLDKVL
jgi:hypothetical protein